MKDIFIYTLQINNTFFIIARLASARFSYTFVALSTMLFLLKTSFFDYSTILLRQTVKSIAKSVNKTNNRMFLKIANCYRYLYTSILMK